VGGWGGRDRRALALELLAGGRDPIGTGPGELLADRGPRIPASCWRCLHPDLTNKGRLSSSWWPVAGLEDGELLEDRGRGIEDRGAPFARC